MTAIIRNLFGGPLVLPVEIACSRLLPDEPTLMEPASGPQRLRLVGHVRADSDKSCDRRQSECKGCQRAENRADDGRPEQPGDPVGSTPAASEAPCKAG